MKLSKAQRLVLWMSPCYVHRAEVRTARSLQRLGLGLLEDNGRMRCDDTRWHFSPTEAGKTQRFENSARADVGARLPA